MPPLALTGTVWLPALWEGRSNEVTRRSCHLQQVPRVSCQAAPVTGGGAHPGLLWVLSADKGTHLRTALNPWEPAHLETRGR